MHSYCFTKRLFSKNPLQNLFLNMSVGKLYFKPSFMYFSHLFWTAFLESSLDNKIMFVFLTKADFAIKNDIYLRSYHLCV